MGNFYTDVIQKDKRFISTAPIRDLALLEPTFRAAVEALIAEAKQQGHELRVGETYRSEPRQLQLFHQGATRLKRVGVHHYGLACDLHLFKDGVFDERGDHYYPILYPLCVTHKLVYGADWGFPPPEKHTFNDWDHVQRVGLTDQDALFAGTWYPDEHWVAKAIG
jgi:hypothetical protein